MVTNNLFSLQSEKHALSALCRNPDLLFDIDPWFSKSDFYQDLHGTIYSLLRQSILAKQSFDSVVISQKIFELGIKNNQDLSIFDYVKSLFQIPTTKDVGVQSFKDVFKLRVRRSLIEGCSELIGYVKKNGDKKIGEIVSGCDKIYGDLVGGIKNVAEEKSYNIFSDIEGIVEGIADSPPDESQFMIGPFKTLNSIYGSLSKPGNITVIGARSGLGKTSFAMFYNIYLAEKYNIPILHLDFGEMSARDLQFRAVCMFTDGDVPFWAIENGSWRQNEEWKRRVREVWKRVKNIKFYYEDISDKKPIEIISLIRRYSLSVFGRGNNFIVNYDYLKPFDTSDYNTPEWKVMGHFIQDVKSFITGELPVPFWASLQLNRSGITTNKGAAQVDDSENSFSISDRILQQSSFSFILRNKLNEELKDEGGLNYGNLKMICVKHRSLGKDIDGALKPVEVSKGSFRKNYVNLLSRSFYFEDKGDLRKMTRELKEKHDVQGEDKDSEIEI